MMNQDEAAGSSKITSVEQITFIHFHSALVTSLAQGRNTVQPDSMFLVLSCEQSIMMNKLDHPTLTKSVSV